MITMKCKDISTQPNDSIENSIWKKDDCFVLVAGSDDFYVVPLSGTYEPWGGCEEEVRDWLRDEGFERVVSGTITLKVG